jgi:hypothetical protein
MDKYGKLFGYDCSVTELGSHDTISRDLKLRIITLVSGSSVMGVILQELEDSFLVGLPSKIYEIGDKRSVEPFLPVPYMRFFKSTILHIIPCYGEFEVYYIRYLMKEGNTLLADRNAAYYLGSDYAERLKKRATILKDLLEKQLTAQEEKAAAPADSKEYDASSVMSATASKYKH